MQVRLLGPVEAVVEGRSVPLGGPKQRTVLALLAAERGRVVPADALIDGIWGDEPTPGARGTLQTYVSNLRAAVGPTLEWEGGGYRLNLEPDQIDSWLFEESVDGARQLVDIQPLEASQRIRDSLALWRGYPYSDASPSLRLEEDARRLNERRVSALEDAIDAELGLGYDAELVPELEVLCAEYPFRERFRAQHMLALYRASRQAEALRAFAKTSRYLGEELGIEPSLELKELEQRILEQDPTLLIEAHPRVETRSFLLVGWDDRPGFSRRAAEMATEILGRVVAEAGGRISRRSRHGLQAVFDDVAGAVCAVEAGHRRFSDASVEISGEAIRMAVDVGEVEVRAGEYLGPPLNRCARLVAAAHGGQVLLSADAHARLSKESGGWHATALGEHEFRGLGRPQPVFQLHVAGSPATFPPLRLDRPPALAGTGFGRMVRGYEIREMVASTDGVVVYHGYQPSMGREVAIRVVRSDLVNETGFIARFEAEAHLVAHLDHPHIIKLHDYWRDPTGAYLVSQWLSGGTLTEALGRGDIGTEILWQVVDQVGSALSFAHRHGVVHGAVGAETVLIDDDDNVYLAGFEVAGDDGDQSIATGIAGDIRDLARLISRLRLAVGQEGGGVGELLHQVGSSVSTHLFESVDEFLAELEMVRGEVVQSQRFTPTANPYKGLRAFDESDHEDFHGRDRLISELVAAVAGHSLVAVVGPSGIGKSSVVRAGLLPALRRGGLPGSERGLITYVTPGSFPFESMTVALSRVAVRWPDSPAEQLTAGPEGMRRLIESVLPPEASLVLVVDQFEELFTLVTDEELRRSFIDGLVELVRHPRSRVRVVLTLRADYLDGPLGYPELGELIRQGMVVVPAQSEEELSEAIRRPAQRVGLDFEPGLVERIVHDVARQPGGLPLLQYALTEMFSHRTSDTFTFEDYQAAGGVLGALGRRADAIYDELGGSARRAAPDVFLRLVAVEESGRDARRRARRRELQTLDRDPGAVNEVLDRYGEHRLLTFDRDPATRSPTVEVAHEALISRWDRLRVWIDERREDLLLHDRLADAVGDWQEADEDPRFLLEGGRLGLLESWALDTDLALTEDERRFIGESRISQDVRETRRRKTRARVTAGLGIAALLSATLALLALDGQRQASRAAQLASAREWAASAINVLDRDAELSLLLALAAIDAAPEGDNPPLETISALHQAVRSNRLVSSRPWSGETSGPVFSGAISPDGTLIAASGGGETLQVSSAGSGDVIWEATDPTAGGWWGPPHFSPDGSLLAAEYVRFWSEERRVEGGRETGVYLFDPGSGNQIEVLHPTGCDWAALPVREVFTRDSSQLIRMVQHLEDGPSGTCFGDGRPGFVDVRMEVVELSTGEVAYWFPATAFRVEGSPVWMPSSIDLARGRMLITDADPDLEMHQVRMLDLHTKEVLWTKPAREGFLSPDGSVVALAGGGAAQQSIELADAETGVTSRHLFGHGAETGDIMFTEEGWLIAGTQDGARVWDMHSGAILMRLTGAPAGVSTISMSSSGLLVGSGWGDHTLRVWDVSNRPLGQGLAVQLDPGAQIASRGISSASGLVGASILQGSCPYQQIFGLLIDADSGEILQRISHHEFWSQMGIITPDGSRLIHQRTGRDVDIDLRCDEKVLGPLVVRDVASGEVVDLEGLCEWLIESDCPAPPQLPYADQILGISISGDGRYAVASGASLAVSVWDLTSGSVVSTWTMDSERLWVTGVAIDPEGSVVAAFHIKDSGGVVKITDLTGGPIAQLEINGNTNRSGHLAFSPGGSRLAVGGASLTVIDTGSWEFEWDAAAHDGGVYHLDFSRDGSLIATTGADGFVRVWRTEDGSLVNVIPFGDEWAKGVAFVDDRSVVVGTSDGLILRLTVDVEELIEIARSRVTREITDQECRTYLHLDSCPAD